MTGPDDSHSNTRPISVAELLAKNGTIGAPPVGGRRRRRRGDTDSISVAELTGEIPIVGVHDDEPAAVDKRVEAPSRNGRAEVVEQTPAETTGEFDAEPVAEHVDDADDVIGAAAAADDADDADAADDDDYAGAVADYSAHLEQRDSDDDLDFFAPPRRSAYAPRRFPLGGASAEQMNPDPVVDDADAGLDLADPEADDEDDLFTDARDDEQPSYRRSTAGPLFGGQSVADDLARRGGRLGPEDIDLRDRDDHVDQLDRLDERDDEPTGMSSALHAAWVVGQCVLAVAFGAGLFVAFDQLWKWNSIVALVLGVLVILGLVVGVRVVRKTEDIGSTLIAVAVGAMVTFGPLALLQAN